MASWDQDQVNELVAALNATHGPIAQEAPMEAAIPVGAAVIVTADAPIHAGSRGEVVEIVPSAYKDMTHRVQLANYQLWFQPCHLVPDNEPNREIRGQE